MADKKIGQTSCLLQSAQQVDNLRLYGTIQRRGWFIENNKFWPEHNRAGNRDPLSLPARKLMRIPVHHIGIEPDIDQCFGNNLALISETAYSFLYGHSLGHNVGNRHPRRERSIRILKYHLHRTPERAQRILAQRINCFPEKNNRSFGVDKPQQRKSQCRLARARLPDHADCLAFPDRERHAVNRFDMADCFPQQTALDRKPDLQIVRLHHDR